MSDADDTWRADLERERQQKDRFFGQHPHSPVPQSEREAFDGLDYYPPAPEYRFRVSLEEFDGTETLTVETTHEGERTYIRWGRFRFELDGEEYALTAYKEDPDDDRLWVPFRDETSGDTTYGAGRYLDLEGSEDRRGDEWDLDFNRAYSPFCAYSPDYECPLVPFENHLDVRIEAGERYEE